MRRRCSMDRIVGTTLDISNAIAQISNANTTSVAPSMTSDVSKMSMFVHGDSMSCGVLEHTDGS